MCFYFAFFSRKNIEFLDFTIDVTDILYYRATENMDGLFEALASVSPEFLVQLRIQRITNYVMEKMLDHLENMTG